MKIFITSALAAVGLVTAVSGAYADGITDFWAIQKGYGYDASTTPAAPGAWPMSASWAGQPAQSESTSTVTVRHPILRKHGKVVEPATHE